MEKRRSPKLFEIISDRFASEWKLLSETESFLAKTPDFHLYERQFQEWRKRLQQRGLPDTELVTLRSEIVSLRRELRLSGYDLSLGLQRLGVQGFLNDDALADGFRRVVICFCDPEVYYWTGSANHVELASELESSLIRRNLLKNPEMHYLWYFRNSKGLILSGSATEPKDHFIRLQDRARANPLKLLAALKKLS